MGGRLVLHVLASGSRGNAAVLEDTVTGAGVLVDCGICKRDFFARCVDAGFDPARLTDVLVTHEHTDHTKGLGVVMRGLAKAGCAPRIHAPSAVRAASAELRALEDSCEIVDMPVGEPFSIDGVGVYPFRTSHDAAASCGFRFEAAPAGDGRADAVGYLTDSGVLTGEAREALVGVRVLAIESNHDAKMLREGPYPWSVKQRIASDVGHLSNDQALEALGALLSDRLEAVVAMHLSEHNNLPSLAIRALEAAVAREGANAHVIAAAQGYGVTVR